MDLINSGLGDRCAQDLDISILVFDDFLLLQDRKEEWNRLVTESVFPNVFQTWQWLSLWWKWFGKNGELCFVLIVKGNDILGGIPLWRSDVSLIPGVSVKGMKLLGDGGPVYPDYLGPVFRKNDIELISKYLVLALEKVGHSANVIQFFGILKGCAPLDVIWTQIEERFHSKRKEGEVAPFLALPNDYESFLKNLHRRRRETIRRQLRRVEKKMELKLCSFNEEDAVDKAFEIIASIYKKSIRGQDLRKGFNNGEYFGFHKEIARAFAEQGWLRIYVLYFDSEPVSFIYGYFFNNTFWYYQTSFKAEYGKLGAGAITIQKVIQAVIQEGAQEFDFLRGDEEYKFGLATGNREMVNLTFFKKRGLDSHLYHSFGFFASLIKQLKNKIV